ncbi:MAG: amino acid permease [Gemmatimonadota bacterium]|nr:amino acid permease [Gemmatimonadota bacterium]MDE3007123.1 amino acid permease [Gemmatimonadota bacterium]MDE3014415.1 amino acid permease [Gemmatimonadota bacterium]
MSSPDGPHPDGLVRTLGPIAAGAFVVTNMIGSGIFTVPAFVRVATGSALASLGVWLAAGLLGLCGALCYSELATRLPRAGGEYRFLTEGYGQLWGFLSGWTSFVVGFSAAVAASSLGVTAYVAPLIGSWDPDAVLVGGVSQGSAAAASLVLALTTVHCIGVRWSGGFQTTLASLVLAAIAILLLAGFSSGNGAWSGLTAAAEPESSWWVALLQVTYAYAGWNAAAYIAGEVRNPRRNLPIAIVGGTLFVIVAYLLLNALFFYALPEAQWESEIAIGAVAAERLFGPGGARTVSAVIALAMFGSVSAMTAVGPRIYFAMARDGVAPRFMGHISERGVAPVAAILAQGILAALLALTGAFSALLIYIGSSLLLFNALTIGTLFVARRRGHAAANTIFRTPLHPVPAIVFIAITLAAWVNGLVEAPVPTGAALGTLTLGAGVYFLGRRISGV